MNDPFEANTSPIGVAILGCGVVGGGVARMLLDKKADYAERIGRKLDLRAIAVRDMSVDRGLPKELLTDDPMGLVRREDVDVVVELMGGVDPAKELVLEALRHGKRVVTANKEVISKHGAELFEAANKYGTAIYLEGSVGGGIPIVMPLKRSLVANRIESILGIINGTTNYILSSMSLKGMSFEEALSEAQASGFAEADPSSDLDGDDAAYKISILASLFLGQRVRSEDVFREGIRKISHADIRYAAELGYAIKLLGIAKVSGSEQKPTLDVRVHPTMIPLSHPLSSINGVSNAIAVRGDAVGEVMFVGPGAGRFPTASAVVGDIINAATSLEHLDRLMLCRHHGAVDYLPIGEISSRYYLRLLTQDAEGVLGRIGTVFGQHGVSIHYFMQKEARDGEAVLVIVTHKVLENNLREALSVVERHPTILEVANIIRVEEEK